MCCPLFKKLYGATLKRHKNTGFFDLISGKGRLYEARIAYPADKSRKHNRLIQAFNNRTLILSAE